MKTPKTTFNILFYLRLERNNKNGAPLMMRVTINGKSAKASLGIRVQPNDWDIKKSRCRLRGHTEGQRINIFIENLVSKCNRAFTSLNEENDVVTANMVIQAIQGKTEGKHQGIIEIYQKQVNELKTLIGKDSSYTLWQKNRTGMNHLKHFLEKKHKASDIPIGHFTYDHVVGLYNFLRAEKGHSHNTAVKCMSMIKKVTSRAFHSGWITRDPFLGFSLGRRPVDRPFLEQHEIESIMNQRPDKKHLELTRDLFIFSCYTGLAYADVKSLKAGEIIRTVDGVDWIKTKRVKTKTKASIPLLPIAKSIINKYARLNDMDANDFVFNVYSNQKINEYLKVIASEAGIVKKVTFHIARHTFATTVTLQNGIPIETVSKMLGHTNIRTTQHYAKVLDSKISKDMEALRTSHLRIA